MDTITSLRDLWAALPELAAEARARATEFEARRSLAPDFTDRLKRAGVFRILVPADVQGLGGVAVRSGWRSSWRSRRPTPRPAGSRRMPASARA